MAYRIQLNMKTQEFIAIDPKNAKHVGKGDTIEKALQQLKRWLITADFNDQRLFFIYFQGIRGRHVKLGAEVSLPWGMFKVTKILFFSPLPF